MVICKYMSKFEYFFFLTRMLLQILTLLGSLAMFLYGMSLMSGGLQKMGDFIINISQSVMEAKVV